ncbi:MAG: hypothetical protein IGS49_27090 [Chlorogloeopsis fritschii C42_A2020_084]|uniref:hypothetical protein n=1 Tax=Chlorogloeopsis fritschii TaxID=1124 RepID=UPI001A08F438|nr:hypothetical protein [Chlorogloeopsis fritschii]MBF2009014.1 hypothetical protein [Chlorogloeopsis fritschii C42_A2020_084]
MPTQFGYFMVFLSTTEGTSFSSYMQRYYRGEAVSQTGVKSLVKEPISFPEVPPSAADIPPLFNEKADRSHLPPNVQAYLESREPIALRAFRQRFPILPDEKIVADSITALSSDWRDYQEGTLVYKRTTNLGSIAFGLPGMKIDLQNGTTSYATLPTHDTPLLVENLALGVDDATATVIDAALTMAQFAGFALGPAGLILSGGAAVLQLIFGRLMSKQQVDLPKEIQKAVSDVITKANLENIDATITTDFDWLNSYYRGAWADNPPTPTDEEYRYFKDALNSKLSSDTGIVQQVNLLMEDDYKFTGFPLFLLGAGLVLVLHKIQLIIASSDKKVVDTTAFSGLMNALDKYIDYGNGTIADIDQKISQRLGQVSAVYQDQNCINMGMYGSHCIKEWDYKDSGTGALYRFPNTSPGCGAAETVEHKDQADSSHSTYVANLTAQLLKQYYNSEPQKAKDTVKQWESMRNEYKQYAQ